MTQREREIIAEAERMEEWRRFYPRIYSNPPDCGEYASAKWPATVMMKVHIAAAEPNKRIRIRGSGSPGDVIGSLLLGLSRYSMPMLWISPALASAIQRTVIPMEINMSDLHLPYPALTIMLPRGAMDSQGSTVSFISYARIITSMGSGFLYATGTDGVPPCFQLSSITRESDKVDLSNIHAWQERRNRDMPVESIGNPDIRAFDADLQAHALHFIVSVVLLIQDRPELMENSLLERRVPHKQDGVKEFWSPAILGRAYKIWHDPTPPQGEHSSPRLHWVSGFWRNQPYGPRIDPRYRRKWIEPFMRGLA